MAAFARYSSSALALGAVLAAGCVEDLPPIEGTTSLRVDLISPTDPGSFDSRLDDDARDTVFDLTALDADGNVDTSVTGTIDIYAHHLGSLTPDYEAGEPLAMIPMQNGVAEGVELALPQVFGPTFLWAEHTRGENATRATGTSPTLFYRDPFLVDVSRPVDEGALDALERSPLERKQVDVTASRYGDAGRLIVTGSYAQGYTVSDVQCQDAAGTPPCVAGAYDHVFVFTFSRPEDENGATVGTAQIVDTVSGAVSEFNGLTELGFPNTFTRGLGVEPSLLPEPVEIDPNWLDTRIELEREEAGLVAVVNATLCPLDDAFETFGQWKLDVGKGCRDSFNIISKGQVAEFDPTEVATGAVFPRVVGTLRPVNIGSFHVWIIFPRTIDDITLPASN